MANIKYRIGLGNCEPGLNESIYDPLPGDEIYRADTTILTADNTIITADYDK